MATNQRKLAAIMFTDMVGYTALTQSNEGRAMELLERHNQILRPFFPKFNGREVKTIGDSFLVEFDSALDALRCAAEIQSYLHEYNQSAQGSWPIRLRIGVHLGDVIHREGDVFGDAVNISSRIEPLASPEGVCISRQVYDQVRNKFDFPLLSLGEKGLKNVEVPTEVFEVTMPWNSKPQEPSAGPRRVAVLPFSNMSPDPADEFFADGITEEIISTVSRIEGAEVISRTSVMQYKKSPKQIRDISKELEVGTVLEGSVRKAGNRLRVTVQMIDAARDRHLWAESYDRTYDDVFAIQTDIAEKVASALRARVSKQGEPPPAENLKAYTLYLKGLQAYHRGTEEAIKEALALFQEAVAQDLKYAKAYAGLAMCWRASAIRMDLAVSVKNAEDAARKSLDLGPDLAESHAAMAAVHMSQDRFEEARVEMEKAVDLNPNLDEGYLLLAEAHTASGRLDEALVYYRKAHALSPLSTGMISMYGRALRLSGRVAEALDLYSTLDESDRGRLFEESLGFMQTGDYKRARERLDKVVQLYPTESFVHFGLALLYAKQGNREEALKELDIMKKAGLESLALNGEFFVLANLGDFDAAFAALDRLADLHSWIFTVKVEPLLNGIQKDPRFADFCRKVGLPPG